MKKLGVLLMMFALFVVSASVFATTDNPYNNMVNDDGIITWEGKGESNVTYINRANYMLDEDVKNQVAQIIIPAEAYIPCYLKLTVQGNEGLAAAESFGPADDKTGHGKAILTSKVNTMVFDNEIGGFVDSNWNRVGHGRNAEVTPFQGLYLEACDTFKVTVYANDQVGYSVKSKKLMNGSKSIELQMATSDKVDGTYSNLYKFDSEQEEINEILTSSKPGEPCKTYTYYHRFRVPYNTEAVQGKYTGTVVFYAYTI